jgi:hypothetical protein
LRFDVDTFDRHRDTEALARRQYGADHRRGGRITDCRPQHLFRMMGS